MITKERIAKLRQLHAEAAKGIVFEPNVPILANAGLARFNKAQLTEAALSALPDLLDAAEQCERLEAALRSAREIAERELAEPHNADTEALVNICTAIDAALEGK